MGCGTSNSVAPFDNEQQAALIKQNNELKEEIEKYKAIASQKETQLDKIQKNLSVSDNVQLKQKKNASEMQKNQYVLLTEENDKLKEEINMFKLMVDQKQIELAEIQKKLAQNENSLLTTRWNYQIKSSQSERIFFNKSLKKMEERDRNLIDKLGDGRMFEDSNFEYFKYTVEKNSTDDTPIKWLRPFEIVANPIVGLEYINPNEVKQGNLGDCWFLAALGAIAKYPHLFKRIIQKDIVLIGQNYKGYFCASFWQYGEWITVYVDDKLPTKRGQLIYASCRTNNNFWVPLLEKCYAKLMGGYEKMIGGVEERALVDLTGLMFISFKPYLLNTLPERFLIEDELNNKNELIGCCAIRIEKKDKKSDDDFDGHAYSILCINNNVMRKNKSERVYTIRNPHGYANESSGWKSSNPVWNEIDETSKRKCLYDENDLLTWMNNDAIKSFFSSMTLAYYVPNLNKNRGNIFEFRDKWTEKDIGLNMSKFIEKKHYLLNVRSKSQKAFVLCNLLQENNGQPLEGISIILLTVRSNKQIINNEFIGSINYNELPDIFTNTTTRQTSCYYFLPAGYYVLIPIIHSNDKLLTANLSLNYIFRVFSNEDISVVKTCYNIERMKFATLEDKPKAINVILRKCNFCEMPIHGQYTHSDNFVYHSECYDCLNICGSCEKKIDGTYYTMQNNLRYCVSCYNYNQDRINSAKAK